MNNFRNNFDAATLNRLQNSVRTWHYSAGLTKKRCALQLQIALNEKGFDLSANDCKNFVRGCFR